MADKRYHWLKLPHDFLKRPDIKIIKSMPDGKDIVLFYLSLMLDSIRHNGDLRFSDLVPYTEEMLSAITDTNIDIVRSAMKILTDLKMVEILEDQTIYMTEVEGMLGGESWSAERMRRLRERQLISGVTSDDDVTRCDEEIDIEKDIEIDKEKEREKKKKSSSPAFAADSDPYVLSGYLKERIMENNPSHRPIEEPQLQRWAKTFDLMLRLDKRDKHDIVDIINFSQDSEFWRANILSADKLREKYDALTLQRRREER